MMLSRTWRIVLLLVVLVLMIWPDLIGRSGVWIALAAVVVLLIGEIVCDGKCESHRISSSTGRKSSRRSATRKRRR